jgi:hypothetical protein
MPANMAVEGGYIYFQFRYNKPMLEEIKNMSGAHWCGFDTPPVKVWRVTNNHRNRFQLIYLQGGNPYEFYDRELEDFTSSRPLRMHQIQMTKHGLTRHYCIIAGEMGVGKSLSAIEIMEHSGVDDWWWVGPKGALKSVELELSKWESRVKPRLLTYDALKKVVKLWKDGDKAPQGIILDESARVKNHTAQRSQAAEHVVDAIRDEHGLNGYAILMTGTPAPKAPTDWWNQAEIACPGFLREGSDKKFRDRLCLTVTAESQYGLSYPKLVTWWDNPEKCGKCGKLKSEHDPIEDDTWEPSKNEVEFLSERLKGLVLVTLKKDCLDLPDKIYRVIDCKPTPSILRVAQVIAKTAPSTIKALTLLRELSDGFQYAEKEVGTQTCSLCNGTKEVQVPEKDSYAEGEEVTYKTVTCNLCKGTGEEPTYERCTDDVACAKDEALVDLLDEYSDVGRLVIYAGFTGSIDKICKLCQDQGWAVIRIDGRGWSVTDSEGIKHDCLNEALKGMDYSSKDNCRFDKLVVVGHPASGSEGLTFTASPAIVYYSNDFNGMYRMQSEDRIHRMGMDTNRGATIIDLFHLPTDKYVFDNLKLKKDLQSISLGKVQGLFDSKDSQ